MCNNQRTKYKTLKGPKQYPQNNLTATHTTTKNLRWQMQLRQSLSGTRVVWEKTYFLLFFLSIRPVENYSPLCSFFYSLSCGCIFSICLRQCSRRECEDFIYMRGKEQLQYSSTILKHLCAFPLPQCWLAYYSRLSAPKYAWLNIREGEVHIWVRTKVWRVNVRNCRENKFKRNGFCSNDLWRALWLTRSAFHYAKIFEYFGREINGTLSISALKFSGQSGPPSEVVLFDLSVRSDLKLLFHLQKSRLQSHFAEM